MGVIRNTAAMQIRGKVGNTTYYIEGGRQIARVSQNGSNYGETASRSIAQQNQRGKWGNLVNFYKVSKTWMPKAFESKKRTQSDYNRFMQINTPRARVYLTRNMYANGGCVADAFRISEGSLRPIQVLAVGNAWRTDIKISWSEIGVGESVADVTADLLKHNSFLREGMQISFISYQQQVSSDGVPTLICTAYEVTLSLTNTEDWVNYLPDFCSAVVDGCLGTSDQISTGAFAYVLSETRNGQTSVSTQTLITNNDVLLAEFTSAEAKAASVASYGVDEDVFLTSGSFPTNPTDQPIYIAGLRFGVGTANERFAAPGSYFNWGSNLFAEEGSVVLAISGRFIAVTNSVIIDDRGAYHAVNATKNANGDIALTLPSGTTFTAAIKQINVVLDGSVYSIAFDTKGITEVD